MRHLVEEFGILLEPTTFGVPRSVSVLTSDFCFTSVLFCTRSDLYECIAITTFGKEGEGEGEMEREREFFFSILFRSEVVEHFCPALDVRIDS